MKVVTTTQKMAINIIRFLPACLTQDHIPPSNSKKETKIF